MSALKLLALPAAEREALREKLADVSLTYAEVAEWLTGRGYPAGKTAVRNFCLHFKLRMQPRNHVPKVSRTLSPADREEYEALLSDPRTTRAAARAWLAERGYSIGESAMRGHRRVFLDALERVRECARHAHEVMRIGRAAGVGGMSEGVQTQMEQVLLEQFVLIKSDERLSPRDLTELSKSVAGAVGSRETLVKIRREHEREKRRAADAGDRAARGGATPIEVAERMREILGV